MKKNHTYTGFTLVETIVSTGIIVIAVLGPLSVAIDSSNYARDSRNQIVATYLAQEAIELLRFYRDTVFLKCINQTSACTAVQVSNGNYEEPNETAWRIFKTNISGTSSGVSCMTSNNPLGCNYDVLGFMPNGFSDVPPNTYAPSDNNCASLYRDDRHQSGLNGGTVTDGMYLCYGNATAFGQGGFSRTNFSRTVKVTSIPPVSNSYDPTYNDDLRVEVKVTYSKSNGLIKQVKVVDFIRARV